jgi:hypothetical protein
VTVEEKLVYDGDNIVWKYMSNFFTAITFRQHIAGLTCVKWSGRFEYPGHKYDSKGVLTWLNMCVADGS